MASAARSAGLDVRVVAGRTSRRIPLAELVVLCVPDGAILDVASRLRDVAPGTGAVVHTAGVLGPDHLAPMRANGWRVGQAHPLAAIATRRTPLLGASILAGGDALATRRASSLARRVGMRLIVLPGLDRRLWHAIAALVANGASTLASLGAKAWIDAGVPAPWAHAALAGLLRSVAFNVGALGTPDALTGPVRRGDAAAVERHFDVLRETADAGNVVRLYASLALGQIDLARTLGEADSASLTQIAQAAERALNDATEPKTARSRARIRRVP